MKYSYSWRVLGEWTGICLPCSSSSPARVSFCDSHVWGGCRFSNANGIILIKWKLGVAIRFWNLTFSPQPKPHRGTGRGPHAAQTADKGWMRCTGTSSLFQRERVLIEHICWASLEPCSSVCSACLCCGGSWLTPFKCYSSHQKWAWKKHEKMKYLSVCLCINKVQGMIKDESDLV